MNFVASILYGVSSSVLVAMLLALAQGRITTATAMVSMVIGGIVVWLGLRFAPRISPRWKNPGAWGWVAILLFSLFSLRAFLWLVFREADTIRVLSPNNLGDFSLHMTYVRYVANGARFWPENPIYAGRPLTYPIGMDVFNSLLTLLGMDVLRGMIWVGLIASVLTGMALWRWGGSFVLTGFLCNGGLAGLQLFLKGQLADFQSDMAWKNFALALFVTQRGLLFAIPAGLLLLCSWRARFRDPDEWHLPLWGEILLYASMPAFHLHTFLFLSAVLGVWICFLPEARVRLLKLVGISFVPATVLVICVTGTFNGPKILGWKLGWMVADKDYLQFCEQAFGWHQGILTVLFFWIYNFGVLPVFVFALLSRRLSQDRGRWRLLLVWTAMGVFFVCCVVKFAPWEWDNTKLMVWSYLVVLPFLWSEVLTKWTAGGRCAAVVALYFSGFLSLLGGLNGTHTGYQVAVRSELDFVEKAVRNLPIEERFLGHPTYNHPLLLNGRKMVMGYTGHIFSHGLPWEERLDQVNAIMNGEPNWRELAKGFGARYLFWGRLESETYTESSQPWKTAAKIVAEGEWGTLYDLEDSKN